MALFDFKMTATEYLSHSYKIPEPQPSLPLDDEDYVRKWQEYKEQDLLTFLKERFSMDTDKCDFKNSTGMALSFVKTMGGELPVVFASNHEDFVIMEALINDRESLREIPKTVNAFTIEAKNEKIYHHRVILLNNAPYSNVSAEKLNLSEDEWLKKSYKLRLRHEAAHYETLRILGGMKNHALDEIIADALGQLAAFSDFSAERQRLFFGLRGDECHGRLEFYCQKVIEEERPLVYKAVNNVLDIIEEKIRKAKSEYLTEKDILFTLAGQSIKDFLGLDGDGQ